jgi:hypothetical protein
VLAAPLPTGTHPQQGAAGGVAPAAHSGRRSYSLRAATKAIIQQYFFMTQV